MLYRALDMNDDSTFGSGLTSFYYNVPAAVAQAIKTCLRLIQGEWFLDKTVGVLYQPDVLGSNTASTRDATIRNAILQVQGVESILKYNSTFDGQTRTFTVTVTVMTIYSADPVTVEVTL